MADSLESNCFGKDGRPRSPLCSNAQEENMNTETHLMMSLFAAVRSGRGRGVLILAAAAVVVDGMS